MDNLTSNLNSQPSGDRSFWAADSRLERIADSAMDAVLTVTLQGEIIDWNRQAQIIFGWSREEAVGRNIADLIIPSHYREHHEERLARFTAERPERDCSKSYRMLAVRRNGQEFPIEFTFTDLEWSGQTILNIFIYDVTTHREVERQGVREKLETALLHHLNQTSLTSDTLEESLLIAIPNLTENLSWSIGHAWIFNADRSRLVSSGIWHFENSTQHEEFKVCTLENTFEKGEGLPGLVWEKEKPVWIQHFDKNEHVLRKLPPEESDIKTAIAFPVVRGKEIVAVVELFRSGELAPDLSLLRLLRNIGDLIGHSIERMDLLAERMRFAAIVESSGDAIIGKALDGTINSWNQGAQKTYGWESEEVIGRTVSVLLLPGMAHEESEILEAMKTGRLLDQFQTRRMRKDGTMIDVSITVSPIRGVDGTIFGTSTIERDITAQRNRELELLKARDAAEQANRVRGEFLASVSHELRTPMNAILGMLELSLQEDLPEFIQDYLATAKDSADSLLLLVNDILDLSRLESGRFELESLVFNVRGCLDDAMKTLSLRAHEKGVELVCHIHSNVPEYMIGDPIRIRQIMLNLVGNALKFTQQGEVMVELQFAGEVKDAELEKIRQRMDESAEDEFANPPASLVDSRYYQLEMSVSDTGIGIADEDQKRIFQPFTQVDSSTTRKYSGTGLGLTICQELIGLMHGELSLESEVDKGSRFTFKILQAIPDETDPILQRPRVTVEELRDLPVLVIDDNKSNQRILKEMLTHWSMKPVMASSAEEALIYLRESKQHKEMYPLLLVDAMMPEMDGFMFLQQARSERLLHSATILMLSSADQRVFGERAEGVDIAAFLEKPVSQSDLLNAIMTVLKGPALRSNTVHKYQKAPQSLKILVAEDTPANQKVITAILKKRGHHATIANNGREAVEYVLNKEENFDIVLMDVQMPTMDGLQATRVIRENERNRESAIPIVAMTAYAMKGDREKCLKSGMDDYISKPIDAVKLIRLIEKHTSPLRKVRRRTEPETETSENMKKSSNPSDKQKTKKMIDMEKAQLRLGGDVHLLNSMVSFFLEDSPALIAKMKESLANGDDDELARAVHSIKGLTSNFDALEITAYTQILEDRAKKGDTAGFSGEIKKLESQVGELIEELKTWRENQAEL
ncbi:Signal transduction histidine-protein kinase BarA [Polystyrenella longa]|uniref:histidine kinase n=1 Tax=Polystyrenella longa TaxID=2528007 RepID=A0A518CLD2_9PLAN|nr:response regulator [Polystyrenella longa]QDU80033.1 Signal transduction histidine-protein kinase BarA [Polystyrenella longa]